MSTSKWMLWDKRTKNEVLLNTLIKLPDGTVCRITAWITPLKGMTPTGKVMLKPTNARESTAYLPADIHLEFRLRNQRKV